MYNHLFTPDALRSAIADGTLSQMLHPVLHMSVAAARAPVQSVGVVITAYNQPQYIADAIRSVKAQTLADFRCVVVDDGSGDDTGDKAREAIAGDARFVLIRQDNAGASAARNAGLKLLPGFCTRVLFLDGDDKLMPDALATLCWHLGNAPAVAGLGLPIDAAGQMLPRPPWWRRNIAAVLPADCFRREWPCLSPGTTLWTRKALEAVGGWPAHLRDAKGDDLRGEDVMLACQVANEVGALKGVSEPVLLYRMHAGGWCANKPRIMRAIDAIQEAIQVYLGPEPEQANGAV